MLGFKDFAFADITITGIELLRCIHKGQFVLSRSPVYNPATSAIWNAAPAELPLGAYEPC
jgi:hypothetical protein